MARLEKGITGALRGSIADKTGKKLHGKALLSQKSNRDNVEYSALQTDQQSVFKQIAGFANTHYLAHLKDAIHPSTKFLSPWNWFMKFSAPAFTSLGLSEPALLKLSYGVRYNPGFLSATAPISSGFLRVFWKGSCIGDYCSGLDSAFNAAYNVQRDEFVYFADTPARFTSLNREPFPEGWAVGQEVFYFLYFIGIDSISSPSFTATTSVIITEEVIP